MSRKLARKNSMKDGSVLNHTEKNGKQIKNRAKLAINGA